MFDVCSTVPRTVLTVPGLSYDDMWGLIVEDRQHRTRACRSVSIDGVSTRSLWPIVAPATGLALILAVWAWGGRAGWASGMIVTPIDAISPDRRRQP